MHSYKAKVTAVIIAKNEATNIRRCLESLNWCDECVVVDDGSVDGTPVVATELGARVLQHSFESFAKQRNWALEHGDLRNEWVLMLDADEASTAAFAIQIDQVLSRVDDKTLAFRTCRMTMYGDKWLKYSDGFPVWIMRLVRRGQPLFQDQGHGEIAVPVLNGRIGTIKEPFLHYPFSRGIEDWLRRHVTYAAREARVKASTLGQPEAGWSALFRRRETRRLAMRRFSRRLPFRGALRFIFQYFIKGGFLDGRAGFDFCRLMSLYESMIIAIENHDVSDAHE